MITKMMAKIVRSLLMLLSFMLAACADSDHAKDGSKVIARVNGEVITENQLTLKINSLFDERQVSMIGDDEKKKVLESIVMGRLLRQQAELDLDENMKLTYHLKAQDYKEKLIVNDYLKSVIDTVPVSDEMVVEYYKKHPEKFGAEEIVTYELLTTSKKLSESKRDRLLSAFPKVTNTGSLQSFSKQLGAAADVDLVYQTGRLLPGVLDKRIESLINNLDIGQMSSLVIQQGRPYVVKTNERKKIAARPLPEVSGEIRRQLAPVALKKVIKEQADKLEKTAAIEYLEYQD